MGSILLRRNCNGVYASGSTKFNEEDKETLLEELSISLNDDEYTLYPASKTDDGSKGFLLIHNSGYKIVFNQRQIYRTCDTCIHLYKYEIIEKNQ